MNWYSVFYWLTVADGVKNFFDVASNIFTALAVIFAFVYIAVAIGKAVAISEGKLRTKEEDEKNSDFRSWSLGKRYVSSLFWVVLALSIFTWCGYVFTPSKKDCVIIVAGGTIGNFLSSDTNSRKIPGKAFSLMNAYMDKTYAELTAEERAAIGVQTNEEKTKATLLNKVEGLGLTRDKAEQIYKILTEKNSTK